MLFTKVRKRYVLMLITFLAIPSALTAEVKARIDIHPAAQKEIELKIEKKNVNGWLTHIGWGAKENRKYSLIFTSNKVSGDWKKISFTFIPQKSGKVNLYLLSSKQEGEDRWVLFDDLKVTGAQIVNPGFETLGSKGNKAIGWTSRGKGYTIINDKSISGEGNNCVKLFHDQPAIQTVEVTAGQSVTVSSLIKLPPLVKKKAVESHPLKLNAELVSHKRYAIFKNDGEAEISLKVTGTRKQNDYIMWTLKDYRGKTLEQGSCEVPRGVQPYLTIIKPGKHGCGYFAFSARLEKANVILPRQGTRPAGIITYGVVPPMKALELKSPDRSRFGIQGTTFCSSGKRLSGDSYNPFYNCIGVKWFYLSAKPQHLEKNGKNTFSPKLTKKSLKFSGLHESRGRLAPLWDLHSVPAWLMNSPRKYKNPASMPTSTECQKYPPRDFSYYGNLIGRIAAENNARRKYIFPYMERNYYQIHWEPDWHWLGSDEDFIRMYAEAHKAIHANDPGAILTGANYGVISKGNRLLKTLLEKGLGKYIDGITTHAYSTKWVSPENSGLIEDMHDLITLTRKYLKPGAPVFQTEWGMTWNGDYSRRNVPLEELLRETAWSLRAHLIILGEGADSTWFFYASDYSGRGWGLAFSLDYPNVKFGPVNISPKPLAMAVCNLTRLLEGTQTVGRLDYLGNNVMCYVFKRGKSLVAALWSGDEQERSIIFDTGLPETTLIDCMGKSRKIPTKSGKIKLVLSAIPVYIHGIASTSIPVSASTKKLVPGQSLSAVKLPEIPKGSSLKLRRGLRSISVNDKFTLPYNINTGKWLLCQENARGYTEKCQTLEIAPLFKIISLTPLSKTCYQLKAVNQGQSALETNLAIYKGDKKLLSRKLPLPAGKESSFELLLPDSETGAIHAVLSDAHGLSQRFDIDPQAMLFALNRSNNPPVADGNLNDWQLESFTQLSNAAALAFKKAPWNGPSDFSVLYSLAYDTKNFYFAVKVRDQTHFPPLRKIEPWRGDSIQLVFGFGVDDKGNSAAVKKISIQVDHNNCTRVCELSSPPPIPPAIIQELKNINIIARRNNEEGTTVYEGVIPWKMLCGFDQISDSRIGFGIMINDADNEIEVEKDARKTIHIGNGAGLFNNSHQQRTINIAR